MGVLVPLAYSLLSILVFYRRRDVRRNDEEEEYSFDNVIRNRNYYLIITSLFQHDDLFSLICDLASILFVGRLSLDHVGVIQNAKNYSRVTITLVNLFHVFVVSAFYLLLSSSFSFVRIGGPCLLGIGHFVIAYCVSTIVYNSLSSFTLSILFLLLAVQIVVHRSNVSSIFCAVLVGLIDPVFFFVFMPYWEVVIAVLVMIVSLLSYIDMRSSVLLPTEDTTTENMNSPLRHIDIMHTARY
ncbi:hypothetical protein WA538_003074, partial [Blastocystis sp. DL]